ncbi:MAG: hypothetical protein AB7F96_02410 [Beijerinckiaceae bacterium]
MPAFLSGAVTSGILAVLFAVVLRARAGKPRLAIWQLALTAIAAAYAVPWGLVLFDKSWRAVPFLPALPVVNEDRLFLGFFAAVFVLAIGHRPAKPPRVPLWGGLLAGVATAVCLPPLLFLATGSYARASLHPDVNVCMVGATGRSQPGEIANTCNMPVVVGLCLSGETNPAPCGQSKTILPGQTVSFDPRGGSLSSLPSNADGLTIVACRPPARPSRMGKTMGRGYEGVCLPPK